jgi:hypothetical protein
VLDVAIAGYAVALVMFLVTGRIDLGFVSISGAAKPILVVWLLVPIRLALQGPPAWLASRVSRGARSIAARTPPAIADVLVAVAVTRAAMWTVAFLTNVLYPAEQARGFAMPFAVTKLAETFAAWDSGWYFDIATRGYYFAAEGQSSIPFFPLYPMAMRALAWPFGSSDAAVWMAGMTISFVSFVAGLLVLHRLTERMLGDREIARRTVLYLSVFPFSFFLTRVYPEGLFFLLTVAAISCGTGSRWWLAGIAGGLATLTRPQGILVALPLVLMAARQGDGVRRIAVRLVALAPIALAFLGYHLYIGRLAGEPLAWLRTQTEWGYSLGHPPWEQLLGLIERLVHYGPYDYFMTSRLAPYRLVHGATALLLLTLTPIMFVRVGAPLGAYALASVLVPLSGSALEGIGRYAAVVFPVFMALATIKSPRFHEAVLIVSSLFLALFVGLFATWRPIY